MILNTNGKQLGRDDMKRLLARVVGLALIGSSYHSSLLAEEQKSPSMVSTQPVPTPSPKFLPLHQQIQNEIIFAGYLFSEDLTTDKVQLNNDTKLYFPLPEAFRKLVEDKKKDFKENTSYLVFASKTNDFENPQSQLTVLLIPTNWLHAKESLSKALQKSYPDRLYPVRRWGIAAHVEVNLSQEVELKSYPGNISLDVREETLINKPVPSQAIPPVQPTVSK
jgi:hypothetical protein